MKKKDPPPDVPPFEPEEPLPEGLRPEDMTANAPPEEFKSDTLSGDIRDVILTHIRSMTVPWAMLNEQEQADKIFAATSAGQDVVRKTVAIIAKNNLPSVSVTVGAYKVDKTLEIRLGASPTLANITALAEHGHGGALLILAEAGDYFGERAPAKPEKNQRSLPLEPTVDD